MATTHITWSWEEAFDKFGFNDGNGWNGSYLVGRFIDDVYDVKTVLSSQGMHNYMIIDILDHDKNSTISEDVEIGYTCPRDYLPKDLVALLDKEFNDFEMHE